MSKFIRIKNLISNLLTFYSVKEKNTSFNGKKIRPYKIKRFIKTKENIMSLTNSKEDKILLSFNGLTVNLSRYVASDLPHEVSVFIPRAEIRKSWKSETYKEYTSEVILNSITILHSPRNETSEKKILEPNIKKTITTEAVAKPKIEIGFKIPNEHNKEQK